MAKILNKTVRLYSEIGTVTLFTLLNGLAVALVVFFGLYVATENIQATEARSITQGLVVNIEGSVADIHKDIQTAAHFYSTIGNNQHHHNDAEGVTATTAENESKKQIEEAEKVMTSGLRLEAVLWATEKGSFHYDNRAQKVHVDDYTPSLGLPTYQDLYSEAFDLDYSRLKYWKHLPWAPFQDKAGVKPENQHVGLLIKVRLDNGDTGMLLAITTPARIFGGSWRVAPRENIERIQISDKETGEIVVDDANSTADGNKGFFYKSVEARSSVKLEDKAWDIRFQVAPTFGTQVLRLSPWISGCLILFLTIFGALTAERKNRQDQKIAEMSKTLEGTHSELQTRISERDRLFHNLRKSEREYRAVINAVSDIIFETDENGKLVFLNETWKRVTDSDVKQTLGTVLFDLLSPADKEKQKEMFEELVRGERQAYRSEASIRLEGWRASRAVEIAFSMLRMTEDKAIRVVGTITDIEKRRAAEIAMKEAEQRFRAIFENSISGIYQTSPEGKFISANPALAEILGYHSIDDLLICIQDISTQIYVNPQDRRDYVQKLLFEGRVSGMEAQVRRKDGSLIWIMENARVVRSERGGILYYEGSIWDVTERKQAEVAMQNARIQAEISSRSRMEFLANMSHELRTPLNAVIGFSEIIKDEIMGPLSVPAYKEYAKDIFESGNYLLKIISEILEVSKIETGNRELNVGNFKITRPMKACMTIMNNRIEQAGVDVKIDLADTLPELLAEELGFKQIMLNLIGNAVKFNNRGGHVTVTARVELGGELAVEVIDDGIGMTEEEIRKAMQPFGKVDNNFTTMKAGTGLGLTIVDSLVRLHGGTFKLVSQKGVGTTARVVFPASCVLNNTNVTAFRAK